jgi:hypothetical protein
MVRGDLKYGPKNDSLTANQAAQQMACRNAPFEIEEVRQLALIAALPTPSWQTSAPEALTATESLFAKNHEPFFNTIDPYRNLVSGSTTSARCHFPAFPVY